MEMNEGVVQLVRQMPLGDDRSGKNMPVSRAPLNLNEEKGLLRAPSDTPYERSPYVSLCLHTMEKLRATRCIGAKAEISLGRHRPGCGCGVLTKLWSILAAGRSRASPGPERCSEWRNCEYGQCQACPCLQEQFDKNCAKFKSPREV